jgi:CHAT domain-containing protein
LLSTSLLTLARIRLSQDRPAEALALISQAFAQLQGNAPQRPLFRFYLLRGQAKAALGQLEAAREDLRSAVEHLRLLRPEAIPSESVRMRAAASQQEVFSGLAETCNELYLRTRRPADLWEAFSAANENRAWAMRQLTGRREDPSPGYAAALAALQAAELQALRERTPLSLSQLNAARLHITELEFAPASSPQAPISAPDLRSFQASLPPHTAVIQFQAGVRHSYAWVLTPGELTVVRLAPTPTLQAAVRRMRERMENDSPSAGQSAHELYQALFGNLPPAARSASRWTVLPDQFLYQVPFAALVSGFSAGRPRFLTEDIALQLTPYLAIPAAAPAPSAGPQFVGFGDPIYNTADSRWHGAAARPGWLRWAGLRPSTPETNSLPRLPGTALEVKRSARAWNRGASTFTGAQVSAASLRSALSGEPEVLHLATHLVPGAADPSESRLMLSLSPSGEPELLDPVAVSHLPARCSLIVMSGCRAGAADAIASEGLLGLSRAWLAAGASSVLATQWPMPDDSGEMWDSFYRAWRSSDLPPGASRAALALQSAQKEMLHSDSWRARPRFWASYFVIGSR